MTGPQAERRLYVEHAVIVSGRVADIYARVLAAPRVAAVLDRLNSPEEIATRAAMRRAAQAYEQGKRNGEARMRPDDPSSPHDPISTGEAAQVLGMSVRRVQQLAAGGLGSRGRGGRWLLDRDAVAALADERRCV